MLSCFLAFESVTAAVSSCMDPASPGKENFLPSVVRSSTFHSDPPFILKGNHMLSVHVCPMCPSEARVLLAPACCTLRLPIKLIPELTEGSVSEAAMQGRPGALAKTREREPRMPLVSSPEDDRPGIWLRSGDASSAPTCQSVVDFVAPGAVVRFSIIQISALAP